MMRRFFTAAIFFLLGAMTLTAFGFEPADEATASMWRKRLIPLPAEVTFGAGSVALDESLKITIACDEPAAAQSAFASLFTQWFGQNPTFALEKRAENDAPIPSDGCRIMAENGTLRIDASNVGGLLNALKTLRQLAEPNRDAEKLTSYYIPELKISDAPALAFRGIHLCWFPETDPTRIEQAIRVAAYYKFNYVTLEMWGTYQYEKRPDFCWSEYAVGKEEIRRLVGIGRELGITLFPQFNLFGHASASRGSSAKHAILSLHPEYQPLFEPDGWSWCLSNPATRAVLTDLVLELYDAFDAPPFFHLGCDEAFSAGTCPVCRKTDYGALFLDHLTYFYNLFHERGCRTMMWHDMLVTAKEFPGYVAFGNAKTAELLDRLPKGMIICDWQYAAPKKDETWPTASFFKEKGFDVLVCPWNVRDGIESLGEKAKNDPLFGILETTWHHLDGTEMRTMLATGARAAWGTGHSGYGADEVDTHLRQIGWDMPTVQYKETGIHTWQLVPETSGPR